MTATECTTMGCPHPGTVAGMYWEDEETFYHVVYCTECAEALKGTGEFIPDADSVRAQEERARLLDVLVSLYTGAREKHWIEAEQLSELVLGDDFWDKAEPDEVRTWLDARLVPTVRKTPTTTVDSQQRLTAQQRLEAERGGDPGDNGAS